MIKGCERESEVLPCSTGDANAVANDILGLVDDMIENNRDEDKVHRNIAEIIQGVMPNDTEKLRFALWAILREPYGCPFCDSGKLRPSAIYKGHSSDCGYKLARAALGVENES